MRFSLAQATDGFAISSGAGKPDAGFRRADSIVVATEKPEEAKDVNKGPTRNKDHCQLGYAHIGGEALWFRRDESHSERSYRILRANKFAKESKAAKIIVDQNTYTLADRLCGPGAT